MVFSGFILGLMLRSYLCMWDCLSNTISGLCRKKGKNMRVPLVDPFFEGEQERPPLPLAGREGEMYLLLSVLENVVLDRPEGARAAMLSGEMGIGKSRLGEELCRAAAE